MGVFTTDKILNYFIRSWPWSDEEKKTIVRQLNFQQVSAVNVPIEHGNEVRVQTDQPDLDQD